MNAELRIALVNALTAATRLMIAHAKWQENRNNLTGGIR